MTERRTNDPDPTQPADLPPRTEPAQPALTVPDSESGDPQVHGRSGDPLNRTRTGSIWVALIVFTAVLVLLLIFILQNTQSVQISYLGASGQVSLAVAMLLAAAAGVLLSAIAGSLRIWQLRKRLRRTTHK